MYVLLNHNRDSHGGAVVIGKHVYEAYEGDGKKSLYEYGFIWADSPTLWVIMGCLIAIATFPLMC